MTTADSDASIRDASVNDAAAIGALHVAAWQAAYAGQMPADFLAGLRAETWGEKRRQAIAEPRRKDTRTLVLEVDGEIVGFSVAGPSRDDDDDPRRTGEVYAVYLYPRQWGRGLGRLLFGRSLEELARSARHEYTVWVLDTNTRAKQFYEAAGFVLDGGLKTISLGGADLVEVRYRRRRPGEHPGE